jgi:hypothetical protein
MLFLRINGLTRENRHEVLSHVKQAVSDGNGWITNFYQYSNLSVCINFEIELKNVAKLNKEIRKTNLLISDETEKAFAELMMMPESSEEIFGTIQIGFVHDEPDLRIECPPIPG